MAKAKIPAFIQEKIDKKTAKEAAVKESKESPKEEAAEGKKGSPKEKAAEAKEAKGKPPFPGAAMPFKRKK